MDAIRAFKPHPVLFICCVKLSAGIIILSQYGNEKSQCLPSQVSAWDCQGCLGGSGLYAKMAGHCQHQQCRCGSGWAFPGHVDQAYGQPCCLCLKVFIRRGSDSAGR